MSFNTMKDWLNRQKTSVSDSVQRFKNKDFMDAVVAGCALVAAADGDISAEEKQKMAGFISRSEELKVFDMQLIIQRFNGFAQGFEFDATIGKAEALKAVGRLKAHPEAGRLLVRVCCAIGMADGDFDADEQAVVRDICAELGLPAEEFGLDEKPPETPAPSAEPAPTPTPAPAPVTPTPAPITTTTTAAETKPIVEQTAPTYVAPSDHKAFMEACVSASALVASADGTISSQEQQSLLAFFAQHPALKNFDAAVINKQFQRAVDNLGFNRTIGKADIIQRLAGLKQEPQVAQAVIDLCYEVARSDGHCSPEEEQDIQALSQGLGL